MLRETEVFGAVNGEDASDALLVGRARGTVLLVEGYLDRGTRADYKRSMACLRFAMRISEAPKKRAMGGRLPSSLDQTCL